MKCFRASPCSIGSIHYCSNKRTEYKTGRSSCLLQRFKSSGNQRKEQAAQMVKSKLVFLKLVEIVLIDICILIASFNSYFEMKIRAKLRRHLQSYRNINFQNWILKTDMNHPKCQNLKITSQSIFIIFVFDLLKKSI